MTVYAAMRDRLLRVRTGPDQPSLTESLREYDLECVAATGENAFCGTFDAGLFRQHEGSSWERIGQDALPDSITAVETSPHDPRELWVGTEPSRVFRSIDAGDTWEERTGLTALPSAGKWSFPPRPNTHHVRWLELDPNDPERVYLGIEAGALVLSADGGETWRDRPDGSRFDNHQLATHSDAPGRVYSAAGDGYAESIDWGETWDHPQEGLEHRYVWSVAVDPDDPDTVLVSAATGARAAHSRGDSYVYRRQGGRWSRIGDEFDVGSGLPTGDGVYRYVLASGTSGGEFYAVSNTGLFRSSDAGETWERVDVEWPSACAEMTARGLVVVAE